jgi:hypothetical protein
MMLNQGQNFSGIYEFQNTRASLNKDCLDDNADAPYKCMLPQYFVNYIKTPIFATQSFTDGWQWDNVFHLPCSDKGCGYDEMKYVDNIRGVFEELIAGKIKHPSAFWVTKCFEHTIVDHEGAWLQQSVRGSIFLMPSIVSWYKTFDSSVDAFDEAWSGNQLQCLSDNTLITKLADSSGSNSDYMMEVDYKKFKVGRFEEADSHEDRVFRKNDAHSSEHEEQVNKVSKGYSDQSKLRHRENKI